MCKSNFKTGQKTEKATNYYVLFCRICDFVYCNRENESGSTRIRTADPLLVRQML